MDKRIQALADRWGFVPSEELVEGFCSKVYADRTRVLRVPFQGEELTSGFIAAHRMAGIVGPTIFESDRETATLLMERMVPGDSLQESTMPDDDALDITVGFIKQIQPLSVEGCTPIARYFDPGPLHQELVETTERETFLHGDLHQENILRHGNRWYVIDPKGVVGDPAAEPFAFILNRLDVHPQFPDLEGLIRHRILRFAKELDLSAWRICSWCLVDVLSRDEPEWRRIEEILKELQMEFRELP